MDGPARRGRGLGTPGGRRGHDCPPELVAHRARLELADLHWYTAPDEGTQGLWRAATEAVPVFEQAEASAPLAEAWWAIAEVHLFHCEFEQMRAALEQGLAAAKDASREERARLQHQSDWRQCWDRLLSRRRVGFAASCAAEVEDHPVYAALLLLYEAHLEALDGRFEEARAMAEASRRPMEEFGRRILLGSQRRYSGQIELLAGEEAAAEALLRDGYQTLREFGERGNAASVAAFLARALQALGRGDEAEAMALEAVDLGSPEDVEMQVYARLARAAARLAADAVEDAVAIASQAVDIAERTDASTMRGDALLELGRALRGTGVEEDADDAVRRALELYDAKGNRVGAATAREFLASPGVSLR